MFHGDDLGVGELVVAHLDDFVELGEEDLLVLLRDEQRCDANNVQLALSHFLFCEVAVEDKDCDVQCLRHEVEATMNVDDPLNKVCAGRCLDFGLHSCEVAGVDLLALLFGTHVLIDILGIH